MAHAQEVVHVGRFSFLSKQKKQYAAFPLFSLSFPLFSFSFRLSLYLHSPRHDFECAARYHAGNELETGRVCGGVVCVWGGDATKPGEWAPVIRKKVQTWNLSHMSA